MTNVTISGIDYSNKRNGQCCEGTSVSFNITPLTAANFDAQITAAEAIQAAIQGVSLIAFEGLAVDALNEPRETARPISPYAQREAKWLVTMSDDVNSRINQFEIGGPDLTLVGADGKTLDVSGGAGLGLLNALEANAISRDGNAMTFVSAVHVGRNN